MLVLGMVVGSTWLCILKIPLSNHRLKGTYFYYDVGDKLKLKNIEFC